MNTLSMDLCNENAASEASAKVKSSTTSQKVPPKDSWYGVVDAVERRKRQNRLNQRAHRLRKQRGEENAHSRPLSAGPTPQSPIASCETVRPIGQSLELTTTAAAATEGIRPGKSSSPGSVATRLLEIPSDRKRAILLQRLAEFYRSHALNSPTASHLLTLTRVNVYRAFVSNMVSLGITWEWMEDDSISPFTMARPGSELVVYPSSLYPTALQQRRIHHTWIDFFPDPVMRDNLLNRGNDWDDEELCTDIMGFWEGCAGGPNSLIVWGEPSDPTNWEVTEGFVSKWGWIVDGCEELMRATNYWRAQRGETPLFWDNAAPYSSLSSTEDLISCGDHASC